MSKSGASRKKKLSPEELLGSISESYQILLVCDAANLNNILENMIHKFSNIEKTSDPVVNKARDSLNWKCQAWRDMLFIHEKNIEVKSQYSAAWGGITREKLKEISEKMQRDFFGRFRSEVELALTECPSYTSFELSTSKAPSNELKYPYQAQPIIFSLKPNNALTTSDKGLWGTMRTGASSNELQASNSPTKNNEAPFTTLGF